MLHTVVTPWPTGAELAEQAAAGAPLGKLLERIVRAGEDAIPGAICTILLMAPDGRHLRHGAAPGMPAIYNEIVNGLEIGPGLGSCGHAAATGRRLIAENVRTHPNWTHFIELADLANFSACFSEPILSSDGKRVLGTLAVYHRAPCSPDEAELELMLRSALLAQAAIEAAPASS